MAKYQCAVCGKSLGTWSAKSPANDKQWLCRSCSLKSCYFFQSHARTLEEYYIHLQQVADGNRIYEALFEPRINLKQDEEGYPYKKASNKHNSDEKVKKYSSTLWAIEDYGMILFKSSRYGKEVKRGEDGRRNLVFRYSDLLSYSCSSGAAATSDDSTSRFISLISDSSYMANEFEISVSDKYVYDAFDNYFSGIINGDKRQRDILADEALARI